MKLMYKAKGDFYIFLRKKIKVRVLFIILFCFTITAVIGQGKTKSISIEEDKFIMSIPADVDVMTDEKTLLKYRKVGDAKTHFYSCSNLSFSIVVSVAAENFTEERMLNMRDQLIAMKSTKDNLIESGDRKTDEQLLL
jgi:hypothetical protein